MFERDEGQVPAWRIAALSDGYFRPKGNCQVGRQSARHFFA